LATLPGDPATLADHWIDGRIKFAVTRKLLQLRHEFSELFARGTYQPLTVEGPHASHVIAFQRTLKRDTIAVAIGRHFARLTDTGRHWPAGLDAEIKFHGTARWQNLLAQDTNIEPDQLDLLGLTEKVPLAVLRAV
jgi:(1->4)-alpha-D-glucan 1-alpha-D-glucosylmutase